MTYLWVSIVGKVIGFWVSSEIYKKYVLLSEEDKEKIKRFVELLVEILSSQYTVEVREKEKSVAKSPEQSTSELVIHKPVIATAPSTTSAPSGILQKIFKEWYQILIEQGFVPGQLYKCQELQAALMKKGIKEYALEVLIRNGYIVSDGDECVLR